MSNIESKFTVMAGRPPHGCSAMEGDFTQKTSPTATLIEGMVAAVENASGDAVIDAMTSGAAAAVPDYPWLVIQGMDQWDTQFVDNVTCLAMKTGLIFKVDSAISVAVGDLVYADAGVLTKLGAGDDKQAVGQVIEINSTAEYIVVAT